MTGKIRKPGPYSRRDRAIIGADGRTAAGKFVAETSRALVDQIGGHPSPMQTLVIKTATIAAFRLHALTERMLADDCPDSKDTDARWRSFARVLLECGDRLGIAAPARAIMPLSSLAQEISRCRDAVDPDEPGRGR